MAVSWYKISQLCGKVGQQRVQEEDQWHVSIHVHMKDSCALPFHDTSSITMSPPERKFAKTRDCHFSYSVSDLELLGKYIKVPGTWSGGSQLIGEKSSFFVLQNIAIIFVCTEKRLPKDAAVSITWLAQDRSLSCCAGGCLRMSELAAATVGVCFGSQFGRLQPITVEKVWHQECQAAGHIEGSVRNWREMKAGSQFCTS